jgi:hypothetical protein
MQPKQKDECGQRPIRAAQAPQDSEHAWQGWSYKARAPWWEGIIYKEILKAANENLDDLVPSQWGFWWGIPFQVVAVLAILAGVTHGEGVTVGQSERGHIIVTPVAQNNQKVWLHRNAWESGHNRGPVCVCFRERGCFWSLGLRI